MQETPQSHCAQNPQIESIAVRNTTRAFEHNKTCDRESACLLTQEESIRHPKPDGFLDQEPSRKNRGR